MTSSFFGTSSIKLAVQSANKMKLFENLKFKNYRARFLKKDLNILR